MAARMLLALLLTTSNLLSVEALKAQATSKMNPIRKVVTLLQKMQAQVTAEGETEEANFKKFMCYCKNNRGKLQSSIEDAKTKLDELTSSLKEDAAKKSQTEADLKEHKESRAEAKEAMAKASAVREKEASAFAAESSDLKTNIAALNKAITAIENGAAGSFIQSGAANFLRKFTMEKADLTDMTRQEVLAFLSGTDTDGYVPQSGEITGILKTMHDEMSKSLADAEAAEKQAIEEYEELMSTKKKEVAGLTKQIEQELARIGALGVKLASAEHDIQDTKDSLAGDSKFLMQLEEGCDGKEKEWEETKKVRAEETLAIAQTIKVLNDDDALDLFKKTLPSSASFMQVQVSAAQVRSQALAEVRRAARTPRHALRAQPKMNLIALALAGKQKGFEQVIGMIDNMNSLLKKEQEEDDSKKEYCDQEFDSSDDKKKVLQQSIADSDAAIADMKGSIQTLTEEVAELEKGIKALDASVAEATALRQTENKEYKELMANDSTAKEVILWAKNRLNKFYNPRLYKAPPARDLSREDQIYTAEGEELATPAAGGIAGTGIGASFVQVAEQTVGPYQKKTQENNGVIAMMDILVSDLDKEMTESEVTEKNSQEEYEKMMAEAGKKRAEDARAIADKTSAKASEEETLEAEESTKDASSKELQAAIKYIHTLHGDCDWLVKYYGTRKTARDEEIDSLNRAKAALSGADYSFVQTKVRHHLRRK